MPPRKTASQRARDLRAKHPDWSLGQIAAELGIAKQSVADALKATGAKRGPKVNLEAKRARLLAQLAEVDRAIAAKGVG